MTPLHKCPGICLCKISIRELCFLYYIYAEISSHACNRIRKMDWLKPQSSNTSVHQEADTDLNDDDIQQGVTGAHFIPKGVPTSFLQRKRFQFPQISRNMKWTNPRLQKTVIATNTDMASVTSSGTHSGTHSVTRSVTPSLSPSVTEVPSRDIYSPSELYDDNLTAESDASSDSRPTDWVVDDKEKKTNLFDRFGPPKSKKPNLDINSTLDTRKTDRDAVVENKKYVRVHLREDIQSSSDPIVKEHLESWPWTSNVLESKTVNGRYFMSISQRAQDHLSEVYDSPDTFVKVSITGYPTSWDKEDVLDTVIESVRGKLFIPCFIELTKEECKFLLLSSVQALTTLINYGLNVRKDNVDLELTVSLTDVTLRWLDFVPNVVLRKIIAAGYDCDKRLSLKAFTLGQDISHFIYFPLNRKSNQSHLVDMGGNVSWEYLAELDLSHNRLTSIAGFDLLETTPRLKHLDLSHNLFEKLSALVCCRDLMLDSIVLEGNPVCNDYTDPTQYVAVIKTLFPSVAVIDGVKIPVQGQMPQFIRNYCPEDAKGVAEVVLEVYFPLLEDSRDQRARIEQLYEDGAVMTVTCRHRLRFAQMYRSLQDMFLRARNIDDGKIDAIEGAATITKYINKWPELQFDFTTFAVDVMYHSETITVLRVTGLVKLMSPSLAEDEHTLAFTKTFIVKSNDGIQYKISNQMVYWDEPTKEFANSGFKITMISKKSLSLKLDTTPDEDLKENFIELFMKLANVNRQISEKCLELKNWHFKNALEYFTKLLKTDALDQLKA